MHKKTKLKMKREKKGRSIKIIDTYCKYTTPFCNKLQIHDRDSITNIPEQ